MAHIYNSDSKEAVLLKECYDLATQFEKSDIAKDILRDKSKQLGVLPSQIPQDSTAFYETEMQVASAVLCALSLEGYSNSENSAFRYDHKVNNLPSDSAEKEYLYSLLALRDARNETQRSNALMHLSKAMDIEKSDPRYIALAMVLQQG